MIELTRFDNLNSIENFHFRKNDVPFLLSIFVVVRFHTLNVEQEKKKNRSTF